MVEISDAVLDELAGPVAAAIPLVIARIPREPAAELGRLRAVADGTWPLRRSLPGPFRGSPNGPWPGGGPAPGPAADGSPVRQALGSLPPLLVERLLGALELTVPELDPAGVPDLTGLVDEPFTGGVGLVISGGVSEAVTKAAVLDQAMPGTVPLVAALTGRLAVHPRVGPLLAVASETIDEAEIAATHGAAWLALAVATCAVVLRGVDAPYWAANPPALLGVAFGTAALLLRENPTPPGYAAAILAKAREEYLLPVAARGRVPVSGHRFALLEEGSVPDADFTANGLVAVVPGGAVIRTGIEEGPVHLVLRVLGEPPPDVASDWEEIVEVSWRATTGAASVVGSREVEPHLRGCMPPWPGDYRLRVHARGRDEADEPEYYELVVWEAPAAPPVVHARADRLGHRLRGEPEPARPGPPEAPYLWLRNSTLSEAATVTVVTGADAADVLRAFNADPARPESMRAIGEEQIRGGSIDPWVAVLDLGGAVLAVEHNGWQGSKKPVLTRASVAGRAASMYWNVNGRTRLSFAERGDVLWSEKPYGDDGAPPEVAASLAGLDFSATRRPGNAMGVLAVERFTGHGFTAEDLARIEAADIAFRIVPDLPELHPYHPRPGGVPEAPTGLTEPALRDLAWWAAAQAARYAGLAEDSDITASVAARALTPPAHLRARRSQLHDGEHRWVWSALHRATNPDPLAAATDAIDAARYAAGPHAADLISDAQARITALGTP